MTLDSYKRAVWRRVHDAEHVDYVLFEQNVTEAWKYNRPIELVVRQIELMIQAFNLPH